MGWGRAGWANWLTVLEPQGRDFPLPKLTTLLVALRDRHSLTLRETKVLELGALGFSSKETATQLDCSPKTVDEHWRRIYKKWQLPSRPKILAEVLAEALWLSSRGSLAAAESQTRL